MQENSLFTVPKRATLTRRKVLDFMLGDGEQTVASSSPPGINAKEGVAQTAKSNRLRVVVVRHCIPRIMGIVQLVEWRNLR